MSDFQLDSQNLNITQNLEEMKSRSQDFGDFAPTAERLIREEMSAQTQEELPIGRSPETDIEDYMRPVEEGFISRSPVSPETTQSELQVDMPENSSFTWTPEFLDKLNGEYAEWVATGEVNP